MNKTFLRFLIIIGALVFPFNLEANSPYEVTSPDGSIKVSVNIDEEISWILSMNGGCIAGPQAVALDLGQNGVLGKDPVLRKYFVESENEIIKTNLYRKYEIIDNYNELHLEFENNYKIIFRAYNEGVAYRFKTSFEKDIVVNTEKAQFIFPGAETVFVPYIHYPYGRYQTSFESTYDVLKMSEIQPDSLIISPLMVKTKNGLSVVVTEADLEDYPGMFFKVNEKADGFDPEFANYPLEEKQGGHNNLQSRVTKRADYIADTEGERVFPWRVFAVAESDYELLDNDLVYKLAAPSRVEDTSWIKPGKVAWDWWNAWNLYDVDFKAGINTTTYKYYVDFAASKGVEYVILDEGWSESTNLLKTIPEIDLKEIVNYAKGKGVGIVLWAGWLPLSRQMDEVMEKYARMGIKGYKIDFMDRDDQKMVNFYYRAARKAAESKQFVLFHGSYKPTGLQRTYPNVLTFEGVYGLEQMKGTDYKDMPRHDVTLPYIRMLAGPMDYTPGAMDNANFVNWRSIYEDPMSQGTRCHQLAMYIVYDSPFSMLCDNPSDYLREPESIDFIASVPTVFDATVPLAGEAGEYVAIARRKESNWYVGAMTNWTGRQVILDFSFLDKDKKYEATIFADGINANTAANDYVRKVMVLDSDTRLPIDMKNGGGWAAVIKEIE
ncbi:glycoside hydrolase family 97 protein [Marinilabilia salmonicolor]|uniref:glycoside hydrolase family 97 protein n=1 Tax=Marinilabilia salmonicolor TaxID=989 RepID=UPI000469D2AA|nr:glycoside hydrolase family 97 protein [Marinilabilia salmonicolor]